MHPSATRGEWQKALEQSLSTFNGDAIEASELLCAVIGALENRYDRYMLGDVQHEFAQLKQALEELQHTAYLADVEVDECAAHHEWQDSIEEETLK